MNKVIVIGNLGRDCEMRYTQGGDAVATVTLATTEQWKDRNGERKERTEWHRVVLWGKMAENLDPYLVKGRRIAVEGKLQTRQWDDKDGHKRYTTEIRADRVVLLGGGGDRERGDRERPARRRREEPAGAPLDTPMDGPEFVTDGDVEFDPAGFEHG